MPGLWGIGSREKARAKAFEQRNAAVKAQPDAFSPLRVARVEKHLTQKQLAAVAEIHPSNLGLIESGRSAGARSSRERIAAALEMNQSELFA